METENKIISDMQKKAFTEEYKTQRLKKQFNKESRLLALNPFIALPLRAFSGYVVEFGGPFLTKQGRGKKRAKQYLCPFKCLVSRVVLLEIAYGLDKGSFLNAFYRMTNQRGLPVEMLSDNGTNFVGAEQGLRELTEKFDAEKIVASGSDKEMKWNFTPLLAPHFGRVHGNMIKSAKKGNQSNSWKCRC